MRGRHRADGRAHPRRAGGIARGEGGAAAVPRGVGRMAPVAVRRRVPRGTRDRRRGRRPGRRHVPGDRRTPAGRIAHRRLPGHHGAIARGRGGDVGAAAAARPQPAAAPRLLADPGRQVLRPQAGPPGRLHLVARLPLSLCVLCRSRGVLARLDRPAARADRRRSGGAAPRLRHGGSRVPGRNVLHASPARRRPRRRLPATRAADHLDGDAQGRPGLPAPRPPRPERPPPPGRRRSGRTSPAGSATPCSERPSARDCAG